MTGFRFPERLGPFSLWIAPEIYPLAEAARTAGETHRALLRARVLLNLPGERLDLAEDEEFLASATGLFRRFEELWEGLERDQSLISVTGVPGVRRAFLASAVEWAMDLHYEVRGVTRRQEGDRARWHVVGRAWDGERPFDCVLESESFLAGDRRAGELALLEALTGCHSGAIRGLIGWSALVPEVARASTRRSEPSPEPRRRAP
jgi:hypothetical protein